MRVRYASNHVTSYPFMINQKHRTLLHMNDDERSAIHVEITIDDFDGVRIIFEDYKIGYAPVLIVNNFQTDLISFGQVDDM